MNKIQLIREVPSYVIDALLEAQQTLFPGSETNQTDNLFEFTKNADPEFYYHDPIFANNILITIIKYDKEAALWLADRATKAIDYKRLDLAVEALSLRLKEETTSL